MKLSFCTIAFQKNKWGKNRAVETPLADILPMLAEAGYDAAEIWSPHLMDLTLGQRDAVASQLKSLRLGVSMISPYFDFTSGVESADSSVSAGLELVGEARRLGARGIRVFTGKVGSADAAAEQWERTATSLRRLCDADPGLLWCMETHSRNLTDTVTGTLRLIELVGRPNLKVIFQPSTFHPDELVALEALAPHTVHVHATNSRDGKASTLSEGDMDYRIILGRLRERSFDGFVSVEWFGEDPAGAARREAKFLRSLA